MQDKCHRYANEVARLTLRAGELALREAASCGNSGSAQRHLPIDLPRWEAQEILAENPEVRNSPLDVPKDNDSIWLHDRTDVIVDRILIEL